MNLQSMIDRGYGLYIINDLLSLKIHDDNIELCISELPGWPDPVFVPIGSRTISGITEEVFDFTTQYLTGYLAYNQMGVKIM